MQSLNTNLDATQSLSKLRGVYETSKRAVRVGTDEPAAAADESVSALRAAGPIAALRDGGDVLAATQIMDRELDTISGSLANLKRLAMQAAAPGFTGDREALNLEYLRVKASISKQASAAGLNTQDLGLGHTEVGDDQAADSAAVALSAAMAMVAGAQKTVTEDRKQAARALNQLQSGISGKSSDPVLSARDADKAARWLATSMQHTETATLAQANMKPAAVLALLGV